MTPIFDGPRPIRPEELRHAHRLAQICFGDIPQNEEDLSAEDLETAPAQPPHVRKAGESHIIASGGKPVSLISIFWEKLYMFDTRVNACNMGGVCTHPDFRGYGLATQLLEHCAQRLVEKGGHLLVISGARGLYQRSGNAPVGRYAEFVIRPGQLRLRDWPAVYGLTLRPARKEDASICNRMYLAEPVRYGRSLPVFREFLTRERWGYHQEEWIVEMYGVPAAYLFLTLPWEHMGHPELGIRGICEFAGSRVALTAALAAAVEQFRLKEIHVPVPWQDSDFFSLLVSSGAKYEWTPLPDHTMRVIDFPGLMNDLKGYVAARLSPGLRRGLRFEQSGPLLGHNGGDRYAIIRGKDRLDLNGWDLTRLVMSSPDCDITGPGALTEILPQIFPLPSFHPGLNYH
jgi:GNAT superfamily N-acetyltransferase